MKADFVVVQHIRTDEIKLINMHDITKIVPTPSIQYFITLKYQEIGIELNDIRNWILKKATLIPIDERETNQIYAR